MNKVIKLDTNNSEFDISTNSLIKFSATWCMPCKSYDPIFSSIASIYPDINFYSVDIGKNTELIKKLNLSIMSVPFTVFFSQGIKVFEQPGVINKDNLIELITEYFI